MTIDFGDFDYWYETEELINNPMDGVGTGEMDFTYADEYTDIYADDNPPATPILDIDIL